MKLPLAPGAKKCVVYDIETFPNWFCIAVSDGEASKLYASHIPGSIAKFVSFVDKNLVLGSFNGFKYDDILLRAIVKNPSIEPSRVNKLSNRIIDPQDETEGDANFKARYSDIPWAYSIDVFCLLNEKGSLKEHACKAGVHNVAESPYPFGEDLPAEGYELVGEYCKLDALNTAKKLIELWNLVTLRTNLSEQFGLGDRVYCLTEQGIAQATFMKLHRDRTGQYSKEVRTACENHPDNLAPAWKLDEILSKKLVFRTPSFQSIFERFRTGRAVREDATGAKWGLQCPTLPDNLAVDLAGVRFQLGVGGLHSIDAPGEFVADDRNGIFDLDVTSYYPSIIIEENLYPKHIGRGFVDDMRTLRDKRVAAKRAGDKTTADALKIVINSTFGKLNDIWSPIRSVPNAMRVTINGQFFLLMLVEMLHRKGATILSSNTDGVTVRWDRSVAAEWMPKVIAAWQKATGFELETTEYSKYVRRDVNTYVAVAVHPRKCPCGCDGAKSKVKLKGAFQADSAKGDGAIVKLAAVAYIAHGIPIETTVNACNDLNKFTYYSRCKSGGTLEFDRQPIGRLARWYVSYVGGILRRRNKDNGYTTLPNGDSATLCMQMPERFEDLCREHYVAEAQKLVDSTKGTP